MTEPEPITPDPAPAQPLTSEEFAKALDQLVTRARAAGIRPLQVMAATYVKQGMDMLDGVLGALEGGKSPKKEKEE